MPCGYVKGGREERGEGGRGGGNIISRRKGGGGRNVLIRKGLLLWPTLDKKT